MQQKTRNLYKYLQNDIDQRRTPTRRIQDAKCMFGSAMEDPGPIVKDPRLGWKQARLGQVL